MKRCGQSCKRGKGMIVKDLGELHGPVLLFGGPYSNLQAMDALARVATARNIPPQNMICTGDTVAYCANPEETVQAIRALNCTVIAGNCEKQLAVGAKDCGCGFDESSTCNLLSRGWYTHALGAVSAGSITWMNMLPDIAVFTHNTRRYAVIHGGISDISRFIWSSSDKNMFRQEIALITKLLGPVDGVIAGHSGIAFMCEIDGLAWINAGAIGMPANDGRPDTQFVVLDDEASIETLAYDFGAAKRSMIGAGLVQGYDQTLVTGDWPSEDTLPLDLRRN